MKHIWDYIFLTGFGLLAAGIWWIYPPACLVVCGLFLLAAGLYGAKVWASSRRSLSEDR